jgi:hypothetical protein
MHQIWAWLQLTTEFREHRPGKPGLQWHLKPWEDQCPGKVKGWQTAEKKVQGSLAGGPGGVGAGGAGDEDQVGLTKEEGDEDADAPAHMAAPSTQRPQRRPHSQVIRRTRPDSGTGHPPRKRKNRAALWQCGAGGGVGGRCWNDPRSSGFRPCYLPVRDPAASFMASP